MLVDHLFQCRISPWPKTAKKRGFRTGVTDRPTNGRMDRRTDGRTDRPSYKDARTHLKTRIFQQDEDEDEDPSEGHDICIMQYWGVRPVFSKILKQICQNVSIDTKMGNLKLCKSIKDRYRCNNLYAQFKIFIFSGSYYRFKREDNR